MICPVGDLSINDGNGRSVDRGIRLYRFHHGCRLTLGLPWLPRASLLPAPSILELGLARPLQCFLATKSEPIQ
jgi:hypothetical protein